MKKKISLLLSGVLLAGMMAGCTGKGNDNSSSTKNEERTSKVIKIASESPLSGGSAAFGESIKLGTQLAVEKQKEEFKKTRF